LGRQSQPVQKTRQEPDLKTEANQTPEKLNSVPSKEQKKGNRRALE